MIKTFWGWHDQQLPDGTIIWTSPAGHTYITTPGSALLFPHLCAPTGDLTPPNPQPTDRCADRSLMMPERHRTRAQNRAHYIATERRHNREARENRRPSCDTTTVGPAPPPDNDDDPPPF